MAKSTKNPSAAPLSCVPHIQPSRREYIHEVEAEESPKYNNNVTLWQTNYVLDLFAYVQQTQLLCKTTNRANERCQEDEEEETHCHVCRSYYYTEHDDDGNPPEHNYSCASQPASQRALINAGSST